MKVYILVLIGLITVGCKTYIEEDYHLVKHLSYDDYKLNFTVTEGTLNPVQLKTYYWFKAREIHHSVGGYSGQLLHGDFTKHYLSNQLAEQGAFKNGLKHGIWKYWYENGNLKRIESWKKGRREGVTIHYNPEGKIIKKGQYFNNRKEGPWIDYKKKDTINFRKGKIKPSRTKKENDTTQGNTSFFKRLFNKKNKD